MGKKIRTRHRYKHAISINPVCAVAIQKKLTINVLNLFHRNYVPCTVDSWLSDPVLPSKGDCVAVCLNSTLLSRGCKSKSNLKQLTLGRIGLRSFCVPTCGEKPHFNAPPHLGTSEVREGLPYPCIFHLPSSSQSTTQTIEI